MCGISGIFEFSPHGVDLGAAALRMNEALRRRGPDDEGVVVFGGGAAPAVCAGPDTPEDVLRSELPYAPGRAQTPGGGQILALGHRRLSIIDLSAAGHQPMCSADGRYWIVFNGEVYNYREIRADLEAHGETFFSDTDTEVILLAYRLWGRACLERFNGMWALAIWDSEARTLFLTRDRLGIKPLYYVLDGDRLLFASDVRALAASGLYDPQPDLEGLWHGLSFYCAPRPMTSFKGVRALRQGSWMEVGADGRTSSGRFWRLPVGELDHGRDAGEWARGLAERLDTSIRRRLVADVPVGTYMSGGVDSPVLSAMAAGLHPGIKAFTLGFEGLASGLDEVGPASATAAMHPMRHVVRTVRPESTLSHVRRMMACYGEPYHALAPNYLISGLAAGEGVTVVLSGLGPDELLCGYNRHAWAGWWRRTRAWNPLVALLAPLHTKLSGLHRFSGAADIMDVYARAMATFTEAEKHRLFDGFAPQAPSPEVFRTLYAPGEDFADDFQAYAYLDIVNFIGNHHMFREDLVSSFFSLECRFPYLDHELVEYAFRMPGRFKLDAQGRGKAPLRRVAEGVVDPSCLSGRKIGFTLPVDIWMRDGLRPLVDESLERLKGRGLFVPRELDRVRRNFLSGRQNHRRLWHLVSMELWFEAFMEGGHKEIFSQPTQVEMN